MSDDSLRGLVPMKTRVVQEGLKTQIEDAASNFVANPSATNWVILTRCMYAWQYFLGLGGTDKKDYNAAMLFSDYPIGQWVEKLLDWMEREMGPIKGFTDGAALAAREVAGNLPGPGELLTMPPNTAALPSTVRKHSDIPKTYGPARTRKAGEEQK